MSEIGLIGKKIGMTREFYKTGLLVPVTVLKMEKGRVIQIIDETKRGYKAVQLGNGKIKKAIVTHCSDEVDKEIILGVNDDSLSSEQNLISSSICDANAIAHIVKWINNDFVIKSGSITTLHPWLGYQNLLDSFSSILSQEFAKLLFRD